MDGELEVVAEATIRHTIQDFNARQLMAMALINTGMPRDQICEKTGLTNRQYAKVFQKHEEGNFDKVTADLINNWEYILRAKLMNVSEVALDKVLALMNTGDMKDAKLASSIFSEVFDKFRLATGKTTESIETTTNLVSKMIASKTGLQKPNQSQYHENIIEINTAPPSMTEVM